MVTSKENTSLPGIISISVYLLEQLSVIRHNLIDRLECCSHPVLFLSIYIRMSQSQCQNASTVQLLTVKSRAVARLGQQHVSVSSTPEKVKGLNSSTSWLVATSIQYLIQSNPKFIYFSYQNSDLILFAPLLYLLSNLLSTHSNRQQPVATHSSPLATLQQPFTSPLIILLIHRLEIWS